jgi:hypothetical protein
MDFKKLKPSHRGLRKYKRTRNILCIEKQTSTRVHGNALSCLRMYREVFKHSQNKLFWKNYMTFNGYHLLCLLKAVEDSDPDVWNRRHMFYPNTVLPLQGDNIRMLSSMSKEWKFGMQFILYGCYSCAYVWHKRRIILSRGLV